MGKSRFQHAKFPFLPCQALCSEDWIETYTREQMFPGSLFHNKALPVCFQVESPTDKAGNFFCSNHWEGNSLSAQLFAQASPVADTPVSLRLGIDSSVIVWPVESCVWPVGPRCLQHSLVSVTRFLNIHSHTILWHLLCLLNVVYFLLLKQSVFGSMGYLG